MQDCAQRKEKLREESSRAFLDGGCGDRGDIARPAKAGTPKVEESESWFCVRSQLKHEHIAAGQLRRCEDIEVFSPRIRYQRATRCGRVWVTEALFQNYFFARFDLALALRRVQHARGVLGVVRFGNHWPAIPPQVIKELQAAMEGQELRVLEDRFKEGDTVEITGGVLHGLQAVVSRVMPARLRVAVLLEFLGRQTTVELQLDQIAFSEGEKCREGWIPAGEEFKSESSTITA
jgi:transcriptional antiterminator RfaH